MEEKMLKDSGLLEMTSSELYLRGGASKALETIFTKIKYVVNFIADYVPKFLQGIVDGCGVRIF